MNDTTKPSRVGSRIAYILAAYGVALVFFTLFRVANTVVYLSSHDVDLQGLYYRALLKGVQFDSLVSCFVLAVPLLLVLVGEIAHINRRWYYMIAHCWVCTFFIICFFACAADIPYYNYSFTHLDAFAVQWGDEAGAVLSMIVSEPSYIAFFFVFVENFRVTARKTGIFETGK